MTDPVEKSKNTIKILAITPIIVAAFVFGGLYLGFYLASLLEISKVIMGLTLSTVGLFASLPVVVKFVGWMIKKEMEAKATGVTTN
jgi:hypothetical protein